MEKGRVNIMPMLSKEINGEVPAHGVAWNITKTPHTIDRDGQYFDSSAVY